MANKLLLETDGLEQCDCCGYYVSPHAINETDQNQWFCNYCFSEWEKEVDNG